jgi:hypothetical protein
MASETPSETPTASETPTETATPSETPSPTLSATSTNTPTPTFTAVPVINGHWTSLGTLDGSNQRIKDLEIHDGVLYAAGIFLNAGGNPNADGVAKYVGGTWESLGTGIQVNTAASYGVEAIVVLDEVVYAAGSFSNAGGDPDADNIAVFADGAWTSLGGEGTRLNGFVNGIAFADGVLYAGGTFTDAGGDAAADRIAKFEDGQWSAVGSGGTAGEVYSVHYYQGAVYITGNFSSVGGVSLSSGIARFDGGVWEGLGGSFGGGSPKPVDLAFYEETIYAIGSIANIGGNFKADGIAKFEDNNWSAVGQFWSSVTNTVVDAITVDDNGVVYIGIDYDGTTYPEVFRFAYGTWNIVGSPSGLNGIVSKLLIEDEVLCAGGSFSDIDGDSELERLVQYGIESVIDTPTPTPTASHTPSRTPTSTKTPTASHTSTPSNTPTATLPAAGNPSTPFDVQYGRTPTFVWTSISGAASYRYEIMRGATFYTAQTVTAIGCATTCAHAPSLVFPDGEYTWRVQANVGGVWGPYSGYVDFYVVAAASENSFDTTVGLWSPVYGTWTLNSGDYEGLAVVNKAGTIKHADTYTSVTLKATMQRTGGGDNYANFIYVRGTPTLDGDGFWRYGYYFAYKNDNYFIIGKDVNGVFTPLTTWEHYSNINSSQPVTLQIDANGSALQFWINGTPVMWGLDSSLTVGQVGIGYYRDSISSSQLEVKAAEVDPIARRLAYETMLTVPSFNSLSVDADLISPFSSEPLLDNEAGPEQEDEPEEQGFFSPEKEQQPETTVAPSIAVSGGGEVASPVRDWLRYANRAARNLREFYPVVQ